MHQHVVLPRPIAEDHQLRRHPMSDQTPQQCPFGGNPDVPRSGDPQLPQSVLPGGRVRERSRTPAELGPPPPWAASAAASKPLLLIDPVVGVWPPEDLQEVEPALALGAGEEGEQLVTDLGAEPLCPWCRAPVSST